MEKRLLPIKVNKHVWFYENPRTLDFVVWSEDKTTATHFLIKKALLKKHL